MQEYRDGPIEEVAVNCARINRSTPTARGQHPICRARFHARSRNRDKNNGCGSRLNRNKVLSRGKELAAEPRRLQTSGGKTDTSLRHNNGRRSRFSPQNLRYAALTPYISVTRNQQDLQRCGNLLTAENAVRYREKGENLLRLPKRW